MAQTPAQCLADYLRRAAVLVACSGVLVGCAALPTSVPAPGQVAGSPNAGCRIVDGKADRRCTPGALNPAVTQATISTTICVPGWSAKVRPPSRVTKRIEREQIVAYGLPGGPDDYELDHIVPLSIGGATDDPRNLYPQSWDGPTGAHAKDKLENRLHRAVCTGRLALGDARQQILNKWTYGGGS